MALPSHDDIIDLARRGLRGCGADLDELLTAEGSGTIPLRSPITGQALGHMRADDAASADAKIGSAAGAFEQWRTVPAPVRGRVVQRWGELLGEHKEDLAALVTVEAGKTPSEAAGEVQEMIDICELALGQSRQLFGKTLPSERPGHRLMETWHPLGVVGIITAFNFPVAVFAWNTALALVCGDPVVWKPSETSTVSAVGAHSLLRRALEENDAPAELNQLLVGDRGLGERLVDDERVALVSATGSVRMGREVGPRVAQRFGRVLLELGGNNAAIVAPSADIDLALRGVVFAAAGTAGQRCTTLRRLIVHESIAGDLVDKIVAAYGTLSIGSPTAEGVLVGPLIGKAAFENMQSALEAAKAQGGEVLCGGQRVLADEAADAYYVEPAVVRMPGQTEIVEAETFAPILYVIEYSDFDDAIALNNAVPQGLSSAVFTSDMAEAERFIAGSDTGIANVNIGTSGAEIGGAFGGNKETGGGRESGTDSWQAYMRQATNTVNYSGELPLAQGVEFL
ncbi:aldehyde dehydrogenase family protein [Brevibacterium sp. BRM-1]|uniref:L-piperidine-6-carboxylate dehydrogenase n=1 Tax=Brevibacterium sp. BRM-1 TaxID=2999062 RepID=UPI0022821E53|nr:aldehyde dehydrogenase family protein [Brevibacterium sp. BRM-1]WAL39983.1 aldehyde dehydrogenase family protein [Brevibacterium sp. BRM-1]